eukprot:COSAG06_NODE_51620_length_311_cov_0.509434_1_plen_45_part_10
MILLRHCSRYRIVRVVLVAAGLPWCVLNSAASRDTRGSLLVANRS